MVAPVCSVAVIRHDLGRDILGLVIFIVRDVKLDRLASVAVGPKLLAFPPLVVADNGVGRIEDLTGAAVILLKADHAAVFILILKGEDILDRSAAEFVYALVVVTDNADVPPSA